MVQWWPLITKIKKSVLTNTHRGRSTVAFVLHTCTFLTQYRHRKVWLGHIKTICTFSQTYTHTHTLLVFSGQLSREHSAIMSCSTFMTDGKCAARRTLFLPSLLHSTSPGSPDLPVGPVAAPAQRRIKWSGQANERRSCWELRQWKNRLTLLINIAALPGES